MKKKLILFVCSFAVIYLVNFFIPQLMPGDPFSYSTTVSGVDGVAYSQEQIAQLQAYYGLDKPVGEQLLDSITRNIQGNFGQSIHYKRDVSEILGERLPWSLLLMGTTLVLSLVGGSALALWSVRRKKADGILYPIFSALGEIPPFLIGILLLFTIAANSDIFPLSGAYTAFATYYSYGAYYYDVFIHAVLPIATLTLVTLPRFYFTARASFLTVSKELYMENARAKGLKEGRIRWRYLFANGVTPIVACFFLSVGGAIGGTMLVENVFAYPGLGTVLKEAVQYRDYPLIQGIFLLATVLTLTSLLLADILNHFADGKGGKK